MWSLETIKQINSEVAKGKSVDQAYANCGIKVPGRILPPKDDGQPPVLKKVRTRPDADKLLAGVTDDNQHEYVDFGPPVGNEVI